MSYISASVKVVSIAEGLVWPHIDTEMCFELTMMVLLV